MDDPTQPDMDMDAPTLASAMGNSDAFEVDEQEDGSAIVSLPEDDEAYESTDFSENLADYLDEDYLTSLGSDTAELVESDRRSREQRDKQYAEGIKRTGLGNEAPGGADFEGASRAVHPMLAKGCVDFASRAIKELFPPTGPCKTQIIGEVTDAKLDKADRKKSYMNWQMTTKVPEQRAEFERLLSQLPLGGSQYKRWWWDIEQQRPRTETVYVDDIFLPYSQADFYSSYRVTHRQWVSKDEFEARVASGLYRDLDLTSPNSDDNQSESKKATNKIEGNEEDSTVYNDEGLREIYMLYVDLKVDGDDYADGRTAPYILHIENDSQQVLGLYRNWSEDDQTYSKKHWMVEYVFLPWRGAYGVGLAHIIGSLAGSATGALRALLDSAHIANFPGGLKLKAGRTAGQSLSINATELAEIDAPAGIDDIRKLVMPFPFAGPSPVLYQILEWLTGQAEGVIATANESIAGAGANMPVGTALALIEHGSTNFSAIHSRCHASLKRELEILHRLDAENITDQEVVEELGELVVTRQDFQGPMDIIPVSDPNIFSEAQRYAQFQALMQLSADPHFTQFFKPDRLLQRGLRILQIPDADDIANLPKEPKRLGPLEENYAVSCAEPSPIKVYGEQDDLNHLKVHLTFMTSPIFGANPIIGSIAAGPLMAHVKDHMVALYKKHAGAAADTASMVAQANGGMITREQAEMAGMAIADKQLAELLAPLMPILDQAQKTAQQFAPKPPVDPTAAAQMAAQAQGQQATLAAQQATTQATLAAQQQTKQMDLQAAAMEADKDRQFQLQMQQAKLAADAAINASDQEQNDRATTMATALEKQSMDMKAAMEQFKVDAAAQAQLRDAEFAAQRQRDKAESDAQILLLKNALDNQSTQIANAQQSPVDQASLIAPLVEAMQANTAQMLEQFQQGLGALHQAHSAPRVARYIKDEMGNNIGVESIVKGNLQ